MNVSIHRVKEINASKVRKQEARETWVRDIEIISEEFSMAAEKLVEVRTVLTVFTNEGPDALGIKRKKR